MGSTVPAIALLVVSLALLLPSPIGAGAAAAAAPHSPVVLPTASPRVVGGHGAPPIFTTAAASAPSAPNPVPFLRTLAPPPVPRPSTVNTSAVFETPPPVPPSTTPVVYTIAHLLVINRSSCCALLNFTPPARPWGMIELNFTGFISGTVYDSSYRFTADGLPVAFGTLPEISHWTILKDLTEYESLFVGNVSFQFILGVATLGGIWTANITLAFFPPETGHAPPSEPNTIVPIWPFIGIQNARPNVSAIVSVPTNATNATLELYAYGFVNDEFWYSTPRPFRDLEISVDGGGLASVIPFAYVNTGGLSDPSLWDPITGIFTLSDPPYHLDVTADLGLLEGSHNLSITALGRDSASNWIIGGSLLLYTSAGTGPATQNFASSPTYAYTNSTVGSTVVQSVTVSYLDSSTIPVGGQALVAVSHTNQSFYDALNATTVAERSKSSEQVVLSGSASPEFHNASSRFSLSFNAAQSSRARGDGNNNVTFHMKAFHQGWNESFVDTRVQAGLAPSVRGFFLDDNASANGTTVADVTPAGVIVAYLSDAANTSKTYRSRILDSPLSATWNSTVTGSMVDQLQESITAHLVTESIAVRATSLLPETDVGQSNTLTASAFGEGPFTYRWFGLPSGCPPPQTSSLTCATAVAGDAQVSVQAIGPLGVAASSVPVGWNVHADPTATFSVSRTAIDLGQSVNLSAKISGGLAPYHCVWASNGTPIGPTGPCPMAFSLLPDQPGTFFLTLQVTDALGFTVTSVPAPLRVAGVPLVAIVILSPSTSVPVGGSVDLSGVVQGGLGPFSYSWTVNDVPALSNQPTASFTFTPARAGNFTMVLSVTDAAGVTVESSSILVTATGGSTQPVGGGGGGGGGGTTATDTGTVAIFAGVGLAAVALVIVLVVSFRRGRGGRPNAPAEPRVEPTYEG